MLEEEILGGGGVAADVDVVHAAAVAAVVVAVRGIVAAAAAAVVRVVGVSSVCGLTCVLGYVRAYSQRASGDGMAMCKSRRGAIKQYTELLAAVVTQRRREWCHHGQKAAEPANVCFRKMECPLWKKRCSLLRSKWIFD